MLLNPSTHQSVKIAEARLELLPNFPNPFIEMTMLRFRLADAANVVLRVFNASGQEVNRIDAKFQEGEHHLVLQRNDLKEPGIYEYQIETDAARSTRRKLVMF